MTKTLQSYIEGLFKNKKVTHINVGSTTAEGAADLKEYTELGRLTLNGAHLDNERYLKTIQSIHKKDNITYLIFDHNNITDLNCDYLGDNFPNLMWLKLIDNPISPNMSVKGLSKCKKLTHL